MTSSNTKRRINGFAGPHPPLQVATWICLPLLVLQFFFFCSPILPLGASIPCSIVFFITAFCSAYYGYMATLTDPVDLYLAQHLKEQGRNNEDSTLAPHCKWKCLQAPPTTMPPPSEEDEELKFCWVCQVSVAHHSMHCKYCNKCVADFDHHCQWLNTCVGHANYPHFFKTLCFLTSMLVVHVAVMIGLVVDIFMNGSSRERAEDWFQANAWQAVVAVLVVFLVLDVIFLTAVVQLLIFHLRLRRMEQTTYQFIVDDNARHRKEVQSAEERKRRRSVAIGKAKRENNNVLALRLQLGQFCGPCDPLPSDKDGGDANGDERLHDEPNNDYQELSSEGEEQKVVDSSIHDESILGTTTPLESQDEQDLLQPPSGEVSSPANGDSLLKGEETKENGEKEETKEELTTMDKV